MMTARSAFAPLLLLLALLPQAASAQALSFVTENLPAGQVGQEYVSTIQATGGVGNYAFAVNSGLLPSGLALSAGGVLQGTPTTAGSYIFTISVTSGTATVLKTYNVLISSANGSTLTITTVSLPQGTIFSGYQASVSAAGGTAPYTFEIVQGSGTLPNGINFVSSGQFLGSPNIAGTFTFTIRVRDAALATFDRTLSITVNSNVLAISTSTLPNGQQGVGYNASLLATGGQAPYNFGVVSGQLPPGIQLSAAGNLTGTPTTTGTFNFRARVTDGVNAIAERDLSIVITVPALSINVVPLPSAVRNVAYSTTITANGGATPYNFSVLTGSLPTGLTLSTGGVISGTPTVSGIFPLTIRVTDNFGSTAQGNFSLSVNTTNISIAPTTLPQGFVGVAYATSIAASGGVAPYIFSQPAGTLPPGLTLASNGLLSGTPTVAGIYNFTVGVVDNNSVSATAAVTVTISNSAISISTGGLAVGQVGQAYSSSLSATGGTAPYSFVQVGGTLPPGLTLFSTGSISGTPSQSGNFGFTVRATDTLGAFAEQGITITIASSGLTILTTSLPGAVLNTVYSATVNVTGGLQPYSFSLNTGVLPPGLVLNPQTGTITGTPTQGGSFPITIRVTDNFNASALANYTIVVGSGTLSLTPTSLTNAIPGQNYTAQLTAIGGTAPYNFSLSSGQLPPGLFLSVGGLISGTPSGNGTFNFTIRVTDFNALIGDFNYSLTVASNQLTILSTTLPTGLAGAGYSFSLLAAGGAPPYEWSAPSGGLPPGLTLTTTGNVLGTPSAAGNYSFLLRVRDQVNTSVDSNVSITINNAGSLTITTTTLPTGQATVFYNQQLTATGGSVPYTWLTVNGQLPPGLTLGPSGVISGVPTTSGIYSFTVRATDAVGSFTQSTLTITVSASGLAILTSALPAAALGVNYTADLTATGGTPPYAFSILNGSLPTGLTLNPNGQITGVPAVGGAFPLTFQVADSGGNAAQTSLTLNVGSSLLQFQTTTLPNATVGIEYNFQLSASGGSPPYIFSVANGGFPAGITLSQSGLISGIATTPGAVNLTLRVTDLNGASVTTLFFFAVGQTQVTFTNPAPPPAFIGNSYSFTFTASNGVAPFQFSVVNGAVPTGLTLSSAGVLSGIPSQTGGFGFTVRATDSNNSFGQQTYQISVSPSGFVITTQSLPAGRVGDAYTAALASSGGVAPVTYFLQPGGTFPVGLTLNQSGTITGTPSQAGTFSFTIGARDSSPSQTTAQRQYTVQIAPAPPRFLTSSLAEGLINQPYVQNLSATGGTGQLVFSLLSGNLPMGLILAANGNLSGTPTQAGTFPLVFRVRDSANPPQTADLSVSLVIQAPVPLTISNFLPGPGQLHFPYTTTYFASGGRPPYTFTVDAGSPPNGLTLNPGGVLTGLLLAPGTYNFRLRATDANNATATVESTITVNPAQFLPPGQVAVGYNARFQPDFGTSPYNVTVNSSAAGRVPPGLALNADGTLTGTPTAPGEYTFGLLVRDAESIFRLATASVRINPAPGALRIAQLTLPPTSVGAAYQQTLRPLGGTPPYSWNVVNGNLPNGLQLNPLTGQIAGSANVAGLQNFTLEVRDSAGGVATNAYTLPVAAAGPPAIAALTNAASYVPEGVAPGEIISIFGNTLGPPELTTFALLDGRVPTILAGVRVLFDGVPAPMLFVRNDQLSAIVPWSVATKPSVRVAVEFLGIQSPPYQLTVLPARPGLFSANASGEGPGAILNQDGSLNTPGNPAAKGSVVVLYATGGGLMNPAGEDGRVASGVSALNLPVAVTVGGVAAEVLYAGNAPGLVEGVVQINVRLSSATPSGAQPVIVDVGGNPSPATVTVSVQ
ncbi:MAG: putative Ig domain-containing protein [Bryobacter sp.]|nr:putative Ig domain-containing protein [Bryobacter sp.]